MRHGDKVKKVGRDAAHTKAILQGLVCELIRHGRIKTTLAKAKAARPFAERMVTFAKKGTLHARRIAIARLQQKDMVRRLFEEIAPLNASRNGGYTRVVKLGPRPSDSAQMAFLEWVDQPAVADDSVIVDPDAKKAEAANA
ncbi:MAG: 50S ribosomal protein L17 [Verrucomicrobia bacterium]|nr:50S ribosomal protein L17 [Verrucomicrobiota bacterium]